MGRRREAEAYLTKHYGGQALPLSEAVRCNCENTACSHRPGNCGATAKRGTNKVIYLGTLCPACFETYSEHYRISGPRWHGGRQRRSRY